MEQKTWKVIAILFIVFSILLAIITLFFWGGSMYWKGEYNLYSKAFVDCADDYDYLKENYDSCTKDAKEIYHNCMDYICNLGKDGCKTSMQKKVSDNMCMEILYGFK